MATLSTFLSRDSLRARSIMSWRKTREQSFLTSVRPSSWWPSSGECNLICNLQSYNFIPQQHHHVHDGRHCSQQALARAFGKCQRGDGHGGCLRIGHVPRRRVYRNQSRGTVSDDWWVKNFHDISITAKSRQAINFERKTLQIILHQLQHHTLIKCCRFSHLLCADYDVAQTYGSLIFQFSCVSCASIA